MKTGRIFLWVAIFGATVGGCQRSEVKRGQTATEREGAILLHCPQLRDLPAPWSVSSLLEGPYIKLTAPAKAFGIRGKEVVGEGGVNYQDVVQATFVPGTYPHAITLGHPEVWPKAGGDPLEIGSYDQYIPNNEKIIFVSKSKRVYGNCAFGPLLKNAANPFCQISDGDHLPKYYVSIVFSAMNPRGMARILSSVDLVGHKLQTCF